MDLLALMKGDLAQHVVDRTGEIEAGPKHLGLALGELGALASLGGRDLGHGSGNAVFIAKNVRAAHGYIPIAFLFVGRSDCSCASSSTESHKARISSAALLFGAYSVTPCPTA